MIPEPPLSWYFRKFVWNSISLVIFALKKAKPIALPPENPEPLRAIPISQRIPGIDIRNILMADHIPPGETSKVMYLSFAFRNWLARILPPVVHGLPQIADDITVAMNQALNWAYRALYPAPRRPRELDTGGPPDLGALATSSPFACFLQRDAEGNLVWDFRDLDKHEVYGGLRPLGARVFFEQDVAQRSLKAVRIESVLGDIAATDDRWGEAVRTALCAASTQTSMVNHFNWVHLACGGPFAIATRNNLGFAHPMCRLMWPHMFGTQNSNFLVTEGQMLHGGDFETVFSFTHAGMCDLFSRTYDGYRASVMVPRLDWRDRGLDGTAFETPVQDNLVQIYAVMLAHTTRYIDIYYPDDAALQRDEPVRAWLKSLDETIPNGISIITGGEVTRAKVAQLAAGFIFMASVQHEILGSMMWNYQMWVDKIPVRIHTDGRRVPVDVFQRLLNANFNLNVNRAKLMVDFSYLAIDDPGAAAFKQFLADLTTLDKSLAEGEDTCWLVRPSRLEANINA
jgi:arachidonate 15-lipoxygenase